MAKIQEMKEFERGIQKEEFRKKIESQKQKSEKVREEKVSLMDLEKLRLESKKAELDTKRELSDLKKEIREQQIAPYKEAFQSARERFGEAQKFLQPAEQPRQLTQAEFQQMQQQPCPQIPQVKERTIEDWIGSSDHARKRTRIEDFI